MLNFIYVFDKIVKGECLHEHILAFVQLGDVDDDEIDDELDDYKNYSLVSDFSDLGNIEMLEAAK